MRLQVFIVDDSIELLTALDQALADLAIGRCVGTAQTEADALAWLDAPTEAWDVLVLEPRLGQGNGLSLLERCRGRPAHQKLVVFTYYATDEMRRYCLAQGADAVFDKSTQLVALIGHLDRLRSVKADPA